MSNMKWNVKSPITKEVRGKYSGLPDVAVQLLWNRDLTTQEQIDEFLKILQTCEMALFAGMDNASDMQSTYEKTVAVITGMEEELS